MDGLIGIWMSWRDGWINGWLGEWMSEWKYGWMEAEIKIRYKSEWVHVYRYVDG